MRPDCERSGCALQYSEQLVPERVQIRLSEAPEVFMQRETQGEPWRNYNGAAQGGELYQEGWWECVVYSTARRRTVRLGSLQGLCERFLIRNLTRYRAPTQAGLYTVQGWGPSSITSFMGRTVCAEYVYTVQCIQVLYQKVLYTFCGSWLKIFRIFNGRMINQKKVMLHGKNSTIRCSVADLDPNYVAVIWSIRDRNSM